MDACRTRLSCQQGNLSEAEQNQRLRMGVVVSTIAMIIAVLVVKADLGWGFRLLMFLPFMVAANGVYMGLYRT
jgi:hypothetical protein